MGMETSYVSIFLVAAFAYAYYYMNGLAFAKHVSCADTMAEKPEKDENYKRYWLVSMIIAATMVGTKLVLKFIPANGAVFTGIISLLALVGSYLYYDTINECDPENEQEKKMALYFMGGFAFGVIASIMRFRQISVKETIEAAS